MDWLTQLIIDLDAHAGEVEQDYWLDGDDADQSVSYCLSCAEKAVREGKGESVMGGYCTENDSCRHCDTCGRVLEYSLTDYGFREELGHFIDNPPAAPLGPEEAYHLAQLIEARPNVDSIMAVAKAARAALDKTPRPTPPEGK